MKNIYKYLVLAIAVVTLAWQLSTPNVWAAGDSAELRTLPLNADKTITFSAKELSKGKKLFSSACASCHVGGATFTNPNVGLDPQTLALATPRRDTVDGLVDYLKNPTTYDGVEEIYELHPSLRSTDIFPALRGFTDKDLKQIAGYLLYQPKVRGIGWGGGKIYY